MKVKNMIGKNGNKIANQFILTDETENGDIVEVFQSYDSVIVKQISHSNGCESTFLDSKYWNYSNTTSKYRNMFLNETTKETKAKIESGEYELVDLN